MLFYTDCVWSVQRFSRSFTVLFVLHAARLLHRDVPHSPAVAFTVATTRLVLDTTVTLRTLRCLPLHNLILRLPPMDRTLPVVLYPTLIDLRAIRLLHCYYSRIILRRPPLRTYRTCRCYTCHYTVASLAPFTAAFVVAPLLHYLPSAPFHPLTRTPRCCCCWCHPCLYSTISTGYTYRLIPAWY